MKASLTSQWGNLGFPGRNIGLILQSLENADFVCVMLNTAMGTDERRERWSEEFPFFLYYKSYACLHPNSSLFPCPLLPLPMPVHPLPPSLSFLTCPYTPSLSFQILSESPRALSVPLSLALLQNPCKVILAQTSLSWLEPASRAGGPRGPWGAHRHRPSLWGREGHPRDASESGGEGSPLGSRGAPS